MGEVRLLSTAAYSDMLHKLKRTDGMNTTADTFSISGYERST